jgi:hypothetical protein
LARYRILAWKDIPAQVQATDDTGAKANRKLPAWFGAEIDRVAMREGLAGTDDYLDKFEWSDETERAGSAEEVVDAVLAELLEAWGNPTL